MYAPGHREMADPTKQIRIRFTFLEFARETDDDDPKKRSRSLPRSFQPTYVQQAELQPAEDLTPEPASSGGDGGMWSSMGSRGHPYICHRPCVRWSKGHCTAGTDCEFCHLAHRAERKLCRKDRKALQSMPLLDLLRVTWRLLEEHGRRVRWADMEGVQPIFDVLTQEFEFARGAARPVEQYRRSDEELLHLQRRLRHTSMNFRSLLVSVAQRCRP
ncbi:unnamed protein product, partial [Symbiodinium natans]